MRIRGALLVVVAVVSTGCAKGLAFRVDERVSITAPRDRESVSLPVVLRWNVEGFDIVEPGTAVRKDAGYFAVFVDRAPMRPGARFVPQRGAYTTTATELVIGEVDADPGTGSERHTATIVLLDGDGRRIGESAFDVVFQIEREETR